MNHDFRATISDANGRAFMRGGPFATAGTRPAALPLFGAAAGTLANFNTLNAQVNGNLALRRSFLAPGAGLSFTSTPTAMANTTMLADQLSGRVSMWSFKPNPSMFAGGSWDAQFKDLLASITGVHHKAMIALWHEPGSEFRDGLFTPAQWRAANRRMGEMVKSHGDPNIKTYIVIEGAWAFTTGNGFAEYEYWDPGFKSVIDYIGFDQYCKPSHGMGVPQILGTKKTNMTWAPLDWAKDKGLPVVIPEFGISDSWGQASKASLIRACWAWAKSYQVPAISYFNNNKDVGSDPEATWEVHDESLVALTDAAANR